MKVELDLSNFVAKADLKYVAGVDRSCFARITDLTNLKSDVDKLDIDKLKNVPRGLNSLKSTFCKLDIGKLENTPVDLSNLSNVVKNDVVKNTQYDEFVKKADNISTTNTSNLVKKTDYNTKINKIENEITTDHDHNKYITTQENKKLTSENFAVNFAQANLESKNNIANFIKNTDFDDKLKNVNKKVISNKTKHVLVENKLNELSEKVTLLSAKDYYFLLGTMYFTSNDGFKNMFAYQFLHLTQ